MDKWTMRLRRTGCAPWTTLERCPPCPAFAHFPTACYHLKERLNNPRLTPARKGHFYFGKKGTSLLWVDRIRANPQPVRQASGTSDNSNSQRVVK